MIESVPVAPQWRCSSCGCVWSASSSPTHCPECSVPALTGTERRMLEEADEVAKLRAELAGETASKNRAYLERNRLVAALSRILPAHLMQHPPDPIWEGDWRWIVCIEGPTGQMTWHLHDSHLPLFMHLKEKPNNWDGHTTEEKYERLAKFNAETLVKGVYDEVARVMKEVGLVDLFAFLKPSRSKT
jgi:hypothetical protein